MAAATDTSEKRELRREQRKTKRTAIVEATIALLFRQHKPATTMDEIAAKSGMSTASLYKYFPDGKDEIYEELIDYVLEMDEAYLEGPLESGKPPLEVLTELGAAYVNFGAQFPALFQFLTQPTDFGPLTGGQAAEIAKRVSRILERVAGVIAQGQRDDIPVEQRFAEHLDPYRTAQVLHGAWNGLVGLSLRDDDLRVDGETLIALSTLATSVVQHGVMSRRLDEPRTVALGMLAQGTAVDAVDAHLRKSFSVTFEEVSTAPSPRDAEQP
jgi:TetR/AcrR family transcriptional regulator